MSIRTFFALTLLVVFASCKSEKKAENEAEVPKMDPITIVEQMPKGTIVPEGMIWIPGGKFYQGAVAKDTLAMNHERPRHEVALDGFFMDAHPITNLQFQKFVEATGYVTIAERKIDWEEMKKQLPPNTPKPHDTILQPGSLVFKKAKSSVPNLYDYSQWWEWKIGANWKHPNGPESSIEGKENHPVVQIAYEDAQAYCDWAGRRLPTEAEWEYAARANKEEVVYFWGNAIDQLGTFANTWEGEFPVTNTLNDGFEFRAPVMTFPKNDFGLYGMAGNVWEWTSDWYNEGYYRELAQKGMIKNPLGASIPYNSNDPYAKEKVIKGGSFLCSVSYCASYRISARMATSLDSGLEHLGFRTVKGIDSSLNIR